MNFNIHELNSNMPATDLLAIFGWVVFSYLYISIGEHQILSLIHISEPTRPY